LRKKSTNISLCRFLPIGLWHQFAGACVEAMQQYEAPVFHVGIPRHMVQGVDQLLYAAIVRML